MVPQWGSWQWGDMLWVLAWSSAGGYVGWALVRNPIGKKVGNKDNRKVQIGIWLLTMGLASLLLYAVCWLAMIAGVWLPLVPSGLVFWGTGVTVTVSTKLKLLEQLVNRKAKELS